MKKLRLSPPEWAALALTLALVLFMSGWFARGAVTAPGTFSISAAHPESAPTPTPSQTVFVPDALIDLNSATLSDLMSLPGIGQTKAQAILDYRAQHGDFRALTELLNVPGIGQSTFDGLKDQISLSTPSTQETSEDST